MNTFLLIVGVEAIIFIGCLLAWACTYYPYRWYVRRRLRIRWDAYMKGVKA